MGYLEQLHIDRIFNAYAAFEDQENFAALKTVSEVLDNHGNMSLSLYVQPKKKDESEVLEFSEAFARWDETGNSLKAAMSELFEILGEK